MLPSHNDDIALAKRLDALISISLNPIKMQEASLKEKIAILVSFDFDNQEIAKILRTTPGLVAKERSILKKGKAVE